MGYITQASSMVDSASEMISKIYASNFTQFLQGLGQPVLVDWYNFNDVLSKVDCGLGTVDNLIGPESPTRYNKINNMPVYGMSRDLIPDVDQGEGDLIDINIELEVTILPNTIRPSEYDFIVYRFGKRSERVILFRVNNVQLSSIKSSSFYKVNVHAIDIDNDDQINLIERYQIARNLVANLERVGTNDKCLIEDTTLEKCNQVEKLIESITRVYRDLFYNERYNSIVLRNGFDAYTIYDPYLTEFIIHSGMLETGRDPITVVVLDQDYNFRYEYSKTFFRALETKSKNEISEYLIYEPTLFSRKNTNPFAFYGEEVVYKLRIREDKKINNPKLTYQRYAFIQNIKEGVDYERGTPIEQSIVRYFNLTSYETLFSEIDLEWLGNYEIKYRFYDMLIIPILIYLLQQYYSALSSSYT